MSCIGDVGGGVGGGGDDCDNYLQLTQHILENGIPVTKTPFYLSAEREKMLSQTMMRLKEI